MQAQTPGFSLDVQGVTGSCPVGEAYAKDQLTAQRVFLMDDVPEKERKAVAREVADKIATKLEETGVSSRRGSVTTR